MVGFSILVCLKIFLFGFHTELTILVEYRIINSKSFPLRTLEASLHYPHCSKQGSSFSFFFFCLYFLFLFFLLVITLVNIGILPLFFVCNFHVTWPGYCKYLQSEDILVLQLWEISFYYLQIICSLSHFLLSSGTPIQ